MDTSARRFTPFKSNSGFSLVELLVVVTVIDILSVIGVAVYQNITSGAKDAQRKADIDAIASALGNKKISDPNQAGYYLTVGDNDFTNGKVPADPKSTRNYCISTATDTTVPSTPSGWDTGCPTTPAGYSAFTGTMPDSTKTWKICAVLEDKTTVACKISATR